MGQTTVLEETFDSLNPDTGEITGSKRHRVIKKKIEPTDEFIKVSRYLNTIFAFRGIPQNLVGISLIFAQRMEFKTNIIYLLKDDKLEIGDMLGIKRRYRKVKGEQTDIPDTNTVDKLIRDCIKYNIIKQTTSRGRFEVNSFLFSTGTIAETKELQAHFDFDEDSMLVSGKTVNLITGNTVRKAVADKKSAMKGQIPGQLSLFDKGAEND